MNRSIPVIQESESELLKLMKQESNKRFYERIQSLYLLQSGQAGDRQGVAASLGRSRRTIGNWFRLYTVPDGLVEILIDDSPLHHVGFVFLEREHRYVGCRKEDLK
ncbi:MAG: hypothetical protein HQM14_20325 [SAR324 cluster bacterium]|nr:hypothetical protein [SAR324 cluster bacterium]